MKPLFSHAQASLLRAVQRLLNAALAYDPDGPVAIIVGSAVSEEWASATFVGERHSIELRLEPELNGDEGAPVDAGHGEACKLSGKASLMKAVVDFVATIGEADLDVPGHFVAEIAVVSFDQLDSGTVRLTLEALTLLN